MNKVASQPGVIDSFQRTLKNLAPDSHMIKGALLMLAERMKASNKADTRSTLLMLRVHCDLILEELQEEEREQRLAQFRTDLRHD